MVEAQSVAKRAKNAAVDVLMKPIGWSDRNVIYVAWGACQAQVEKNGGPKVGTEENSNKHRTLLCGFRKNRGEQKIQTPGF